MTQYLLLNRIQVQNANAVAGFTWGFPAITHFLGFTHNLSRKLAMSKYQGTSLKGCAVVSHEHHVHTYGKYNDRFLQSKNPAYLQGDVNKVAKGGAPSIVEEGKMNMTVSLVIEFDGFIGREVGELLLWLKHKCLMQRLAGGSILTIGDVKIFDGNNQQDIFKLKRALLPGFVLMDRSNYLAEHYQNCKSENSEAEQLDAWLDFIILKQQARPASTLINKHLKSRDESKLYDIWMGHLAQPYSNNIPQELTDYFSTLELSKLTKPLLKQWEEYMSPTGKTAAVWQYMNKPKLGYLVPIMTGYKAISPVYDNCDVANTRDSETPVCFVEAVHSIGEWVGVNRLKNNEDVAGCLWIYQYDDGWYLCQQIKQTNSEVSDLEQQVLDLFDPINELV